MTDRILALCSHEENRKSLKLVADFAAQALQATYEQVSFNQIMTGALGRDVFSEGMDSVVEGPEGTIPPEVVRSIAEEIRKTTTEWPVSMIITDLPQDHRESGLEMLLAAELNVETAFVRLKPARKIKRVVITTGGGPHALDGLRYGVKAAAALNAETLALRVVRPSEMRGGIWAEKEYIHRVTELISMQAAMAGVTIPVKTVVAESVSKAILSECGENDLLIMGVTSKWRYNKLAGTLPEEVASQTSSSVMIVYAPLRDELPLTDVFWERNILLDPECENRWQLLSHMADTLIADRQLSEEMRARVIATIYNRELESATSTGRGVAIPHAALPGFEGAVGCLAILREEVDFGGDPVRLVFLLVTSESDYQEYIRILGKIAKLILKPGFAEKLMDATNPAEAVALIREAERDG